MSRRGRWYRPIRYILDISGARFLPYGNADGQRFCAQPGCASPPVVVAGDLQHSRAGDAVVATELYYCEGHGRNYADLHGLTLPGAGP